MPCRARRAVARQTHRRELVLRSGLPGGRVRQRMLRTRKVGGIGAARPGRALRVVGRIPGLARIRRLRGGLVRQHDPDEVEIGLRVAAVARGTARRDELPGRLEPAQHRGSDPGKLDGQRGSRLADGQRAPGHPAVGGGGVPIPPAGARPALGCTARSARASPTTVRRPARARHGVSRSSWCQMVLGAVAAFGSSMSGASDRIG